MSAWKQGVRQALASTTLREALQANAHRRRAAWDRAMATLPVPWEEARERAAAFREQVLARWEEHLETFVQRVREHGVVVHRVADAHEARERILTLAREHNVRLVVKSKSMLTEEIDLNPALEALGIEVVETDLGEFIVQLRGERPAHIITPAVHLRRQDVARLFTRRLGMPYTEDVARMTQTARRYLREKFRRADMGISGVNFGVVETGTLVLVTNEGNGRMVTTAPRVHVAVMGMERLVLTLEHLAWMLRLLPRAATGQTLTSYVSLLHGPGPGGPRSRHLVLVDNGRSALARGPLAEVLRCIRCGACLNACPVFAQVGGHGYRSRAGAYTPYPGPMGIPVSLGLLGEAYDAMSLLCTLCGACAEVCPVAIPLPELILQVRRERPVEQVLPGWVRWGLNGYTKSAAHPSLFRIAQRLLRRFLPLLAARTAIPLLQGAALRRHGPLPPRPRPSTTPDRHARPEPIPTPAPADLLEAFTLQARQVDVEVVPVAAPDRLAPQVVQWCREQGIRTLWPWAEPHLPPGLLAALQEAGLTLKADPEADAGLTGVEQAIAETGSLLLPGDAARPLGASLWPRVHLAVVPASRVVARLEDALTPDRVVHHPASVLVTGPSRTADIEMTLTLGVHGPERVTVFLVEGL